ncbi:hypothetical protein C0J52_15141, partial [Blattella germanica]
YLPPQIVLELTWEEEKKDDGTKWNFLEHKGPVFAPLYEPLPRDIKFFYDALFTTVSPYDAISCNVKSDSIWSAFKLAATNIVESVNEQV